MVYNSDSLEITSHPTEKQLREQPALPRTSAPKTAGLCWRKAGHAVRTLGDQNDRRCTRVYRNVKTHHQKAEGDVTKVRNAVLVRIVGVSSLNSVS